MPEREVPTEDVWTEFLRWIGWTDEDMLDRQPEDIIHRRWTLYQKKAEYGMLEP